MKRSKDDVIFKYHVNDVVNVSNNICFAGTYKAKIAHVYLFKQVMVLGLHPITLLN